MTWRATFGGWQPFVDGRLSDSSGDSPSGYVLKNTLSGIARHRAATIDFRQNLVAITSYDYDSGSSPLVSSSQDLFWSLSWIVNDKVTLTGYTTKGLTL